MLMTWERQILTEICGPTEGNGQWRIETGAELITKYKSQDIVTVIKIGMAWVRYWNEREKVCVEESFGGEEGEDDPD
jgi:hypothetical protein